MRGGYYVLRDVTGSQDLIDHHVPEVHVLMRALAARGRVPRCRRVGCETVDLGKPPADINACRPSQEFFIDEIWPNFLAKEATAACTVTTPACHGALAPNALRH